MKLMHLELKLAPSDLSGKPAGFIAGIASTPRPDSYNDVVQPGAFDDSIRRRGQGGFGGPDGIAMLAHHDTESLIGVWDLIETRGDALYVEGRLNLEVDEAKELYSMVKMGAAIGFSVGFRVVKRSYIDEPDGSTKRIIESGDIREISLVTFPANEECGVTAVKSEPPSRPGIEKFEAPSDFVKWAVDQFTISRKQGDLLWKVTQANGHLFSAGKGREPESTAKTDPSVSAGYEAAIQHLEEIKAAELAALIRASAASL